MADIDRMKALIDAKAGWVRTHYLTIAPGQEATYYLKAEHAKDYTARNYVGDIPAMVQAEANARGCTPVQATQILMAVLDSWTQIAAGVEYARLKAKNDMDAATTDEEVEAAYNTGMDALIAMVP